VVARYSMSGQPGVCRHTFINYPEGKLHVLSAGDHGSTVRLLGGAYPVSAVGDVLDNGTRVGVHNESVRRPWLRPDLE
jgi:hypothetical protein